MMKAQHSPVRMGLIVGVVLLFTATIAFVSLWIVSARIDTGKCFQVRAVPFKRVWGGGGGTEGLLKGPNSELIYPIRLHMISGRRGWGVSNF